MEPWGAQVIKNKKTTRQRIREARNSKYYSDAESRIRNLKHFAPTSDSDTRQGELWQSYIEHNDDLEILEEHDLSVLAPATHPLYRYAQTRILGTNAIDGTSARQYFKEFYALGVPQDRIIHAALWNGALWVFCGNKRVRAHEMAIAAGNKSLCNLVVIDLNDYTEIQFKRRIKTLAEISNRQTHWTRPEVSDDLVHQVLTEWEIISEEEPAYLAYTEEEKLEWAKQEIIVRNDRYDLPKMVTALGTLANACFASHIGQVIAHEQDWEGTSILYSTYFSGTWNIENQHARMIFMPSAKQSVLRRMTEWWSNQSVDTNDNHPHYLILRAGKTYGTSLTSLKSVIDERRSVMKALTEFNMNQRHRSAKYPLVQRVIWVHQIAELTETEAWQWDAAEQQYTEVEIRNG